MVQMNQTFTIFHDEIMLHRGSEGADPVRKSHTNIYPGFGKDPDVALQSIMEDIAENDSEALQEDFSDDPGQYDTLLALAIDDLPGTWEVYAGVLQTRPDGVAPLLSEGE